MTLAVTRNIAKLCFRNNPSFYAFAKAHNLVRDFKPGPFPKTPEERAAAAAKYGLHPEDYQPYPDDGTGYGDYPMMKPIGGDSRDPYYPYDIPALKRNFTETFHPDDDMYGEDRYDISARHLVSPTRAWLTLTAVLGGFFAIHYFFDDFRMFPATIPTQYPNKGKVHYTFEPAE